MLFVNKFSLAMPDKSFWYLFLHCINTLEDEKIFWTWALSLLHFGLLETKDDNCGYNL